MSEEDFLSRIGRAEVLAEENKHTIQDLKAVLLDLQRQIKQKEIKISELEKESRRVTDKVSQLDSNLKISLEKQSKRILGSVSSLIYEAKKKPQVQPLRKKLAELPNILDEELQLRLLQEDITDFNLIPWSADQNPQVQELLKKLGDEKRAITEVGILHRRLQEGSGFPVEAAEAANLKSITTGLLSDLSKLNPIILEGLYEPEEVQTAIINLRISDADLCLREQYKENEKEMKKRTCEQYFARQLDTNSRREAIDILDAIFLRKLNEYASQGEDCDFPCLSYYSPEQVFARFQGLSQLGEEDFEDFSKGTSGEMQFVTSDGFFDLIDQIKNEFEGDYNERYALVDLPDAEKEKIWQDTVSEQKKKPDSVVAACMKNYWQGLMESMKILPDRADLLSRVDALDGRVAALFSRSHEDERASQGASSPVVSCSFLRPPGVQ